jgi:hypothetical protein
MTATKNNDTKETVTDLASGIIPGLRKHFPNGAQMLTFGGGSVTATVDQTVTNLQALIDNRTAVTNAQAAVKVAITAENGKMPALVAFLHALEAFIRLTFGASATTLADFSLEPPKARTPMTAEAKAVAKAKAAATRKARGTTSAKAKKAITGNVSATLVVTPAAPAPATPEPAAPAAPAPTKA